MKAVWLEKASSIALNLYDQAKAKGLSQEKDLETNKPPSKEGRKLEENV